MLFVRALQPIKRFVNPIFKRHQITTSISKLMKSREEFVKNLCSMNKIKLTFVFIGLLAFVGCTRCTDCENNGITDRICEQDFDDPNAYNAAVANQEADGAECVAVI